MLFHKLQYYFYLFLYLKKLVVCFDSIPYESIISPNKEGCVIPEGDNEALSNTLYELMNDESMRIRMGEIAYEKSKNWNVETIIEHFNKFLKLHE